MTTPLFRQQVIDAQRDRLAGAVIAATPPRAGLYALLLIAVAAAIAAMLAFGQHAMRAQVKGVVAYDNGIARVHPNAPGEVRMVHVREGQEVRAGAPLVTLALAQGGGLSPQLTDLARQDEELMRQQALAGTLSEAEIGSLERQRANLAAAIASLERQRGLAAGQIRLAEAEVRRAVALAAEGAGTQRQVEESRAVLLSRRAEVEGLAGQIIQQRDALRAAEGQIAQRRIEVERGRSELAAQRSALSEQRGGLSRQDSMVLAAPVDGVVEQVATQIGQRATPDTSLVTVVPTGGRMEIWLYAPTRGAGFVQPGQQVRLLFDAFPHQVYGAGHGSVVEVARVPVDGASLGPQLGFEEPVFRIRVAIDSLPEAARAGGRLRAGMTLTANIVLERRPLWAMLFNPFREALRP